MREVSAEPPLRVLGSMALRADGDDLPFGRSARLRRVLAALVIHQGEVVGVDRLAEIAWGMRQPVEPRSALHNLVSRLRTLLAPAPGLDVVTRPPGYVLLAEAGAVDAGLFEDRVRAGRRAPDPALARACYDEALALWHGPAYVEFADEDFARPEAARLTALRQVAIEERFDALLASGDPAAIVGDLERAAAADPFRERIRRQLMLALHRSGRTPQALAVARDYRAFLADELGLDPGEELRQLERDILRQEPSGLVAAAPAVPPTAVRVPALVGREDDLAAAEELLGTRGVVTLVGVGGVGKTLLARHLLDRVGPRYADGVLRCELGPITEPDDVVDVVGAALGLIPASGPDRVHRLAEILGPRRALLFLDNCEHVRAAVAELVERARCAGGAVRVLATSRAPLGLPDEQVWRVEPLPVATAAELFAARARLVLPGFEPPPDLDALCRRLDGIPLAIELAAARSGVLTVGEMLDRLDGQSHLLATHHPAIVARHRSLHAVVEWSYRLLEPDHRSVFDQLSVFPDEFTLSAAAGIVSAVEAESIVLDLVDRSLVRPTTRAGRGRYGLLDTLRRYGHARLVERGRLDDLRARHAAWYLDRAAALGSSGGAGHSDWIAGLDREMPNLRAAFRWLHSTVDIDGLLRLAEALHYYALYSLNPEVFDWARQTIALLGDRRDPRLATAYATAADGAWLANDAAASRAFAERAVAASSGGDPASSGAALVSLGNALAGVDGQLERRAALYHRAARVAASEPHRLIAELLYGSALIHQGRDGLAVVELALRDARALGSPDLEAKAELIRADHLLPAEPAEALAGYWRAAALNDRAGNRYQEYQIMISAAFAEIMYGSPARAATTFRSLLTRWTGLLREAPVLNVLRGLVILLADAGRPEAAAVLAGAIPTETFAIAFTVDADALARFAAVRAGLARTHADAVSRGPRLDREAIVDLALTNLDVITR